MNYIDDLRKKKEEIIENERKNSFYASLRKIKRWSEDEFTLWKTTDELEKVYKLVKTDIERAKVNELKDIIDKKLSVRRPVAAVIKFDIDSSVKMEVSGVAIATKLAQNLSATYQLVERSQIGKAMKELRFQSTDLVSGNVRKVGKFLGAEFMITGSVVQIGREITIAAKIFNIENGATKQTAEVTTDNINDLNSMFMEIARVLNMTHAEKKKFMDEKFNYPKNLENGKYAFGRKDYRNAVKWYKKALYSKRTPEVEGLLDKAEIELEKILELERLQKEFDDSVNSGKEFMKNKMFDKAEIAFNKALKVKGYEQSKDIIKLANSAKIEKELAIKKANALSLFYKLQKEIDESEYYKIGCVTELNLNQAVKWYNSIPAKVAKLRNSQSQYLSDEINDKLNELEKDIKGLHKSELNRILKERKDKFDNSIKRADQLMDLEKWDDAEKEFKLALKIIGFEDSDIAKQGIISASNGAEIARRRKLAETKYLKLESNIKNKNFILGNIADNDIDKAIQWFDSSISKLNSFSKENKYLASSYKIKLQELSKKLLTIKESEIARIAKERKTKYDELIKNGQQFLKEEKWEKAKSSFSSALLVKTYEQDAIAKDGLKSALGGAELAIKIKIAEDEFAEIQKNILSNSFMSKIEEEKLNEALVWYDLKIKELKDLLVKQNKYLTVITKTNINKLIEKINSVKTSEIARIAKERKDEYDELIKSGQQF